MSAVCFQLVGSNQTRTVTISCLSTKHASNSCETLRSTLEKWFSITNVLMRFRQKRRGGRGSGLTMSQVALILLSSADRRSPGRNSGDNKKTEATIAIVIICSQSDGNVFKFDLQLCLHFMRAAAKTSWLLCAKIMKNNLFSRQNPCYGLTITGGHGPLGWRSFVSRQWRESRV